MREGDTIRADVAVVGGGLIGPALAVALARAGLSVAVVDRLAEEVRADPEFDGRAYAVAFASAKLLGALGLWRDLEPRAQEIRDIVVREGRAEDHPRAQLHFDPRELGEGRVGWILEDRWLRQSLLRAMRETPGITHIAPAGLSSAAFEGPCARLTLTDGRVVEAPLAVAADGRRSALADAAGVRRQTFRYGQSGLVCAISHEHDHEGVAYQSFFPGGPFAVLPLPGRRSAIVWSERTKTAERLAALDDRAYEAELAHRIGPRLGAIRLEGRRASHPLDLTLAERYVAPRLALAGDAAHGVHPIAGQGMNLGFRDIAALAEVVVEASRRGEDIGALDVLERYERWRRFDATSFALGMDALNRLFSNANPVLSALRGAGLAMVGRMGPARRTFMREAMGASGDIPRLLRGEQP